MCCPSSELARARSWQRFSPGFALPAKQTITAPPAQWDEVVQTTDETPSGSNRLAIGLTRRKAAFVAFVESTRAALRVPGAAVAVVQDGQVVLERGFGVRALGHKPSKADSVTADTPFLIRSTATSLSTRVMARAPRPRHWPLGIARPGVDSGHATAQSH